MELFRSCFLRYVQEFSREEGSLAGKTATEEARLIELLGMDLPANPLFNELSAEERRLVLRLSRELFIQPARFSRDLAADLALSREDLIRLYRVIRGTGAIQNLLTFDSPLRRRVSFLRKELFPENIPKLTSMFGGDLCLPSQIEFHPSLVCNLRCKACPNCQADSSGAWHFLGYPEIGKPLNSSRLRLLEEMFLDLGVEKFSFGGGGEPSLSDCTLDGITHLRSRSSKTEISLYTNGIFSDKWKQGEFETLVASLNKLRFSIDAADAQEWSQYKGCPPELFEVLWENIQAIVACRSRVSGAVRLGASCIVSNLNYRNVDTFLARARDTGLDFCDIKALETCFGEKSEFKAKTEEFREIFAELLVKMGNGHFAPLDVVVDDSLQYHDDTAGADDVSPTRCWISLRGRMLTVGPYAELHPCSDVANPGAQYRRVSEGLIGHLTAFDNLNSLRSQFMTLWRESLPRRALWSRTNCSYCVPSHNNYNVVIEKLYQDWKFGIMPEAQPFACELDHYLTGRGLT